MIYCALLYAGLKWSIFCPGTCCTDQYNTNFSFTKDICDITIEEIHGYVTFHRLVSL